MNMISLAALKPQIVDIRISGFGEPVTIPALPLTYVEWQNAAIGLIPPKPNKVRLAPADKTQPPIDALDYGDLEYQRLDTEYKNEVAMRRCAVAMAGAGIPELQGKSLDDQAELVRGVDAGVLKAYYQVLEGLAQRRSGSWFRREPQSTSQDDHADLPPDGVEAGEGLGGTQ
jgi:hypothetical protein